MVLIDEKDYPFPMTFLKEVRLDFQRHLDDTRSLSHKLSTLLITVGVYWGLIVGSILSDEIVFSSLSPTFIVISLTAIPLLVILYAFKFNSTKYLTEHMCFICHVGTQRTNKIKEITKSGIDNTLDIFESYMDLIIMVKEKNNKTSHLLTAAMILFVAAIFATLFLFQTS